MLALCTFGALGLSIKFGRLQRKVSSYLHALGGVAAIAVEVEVVVITIVVVVVTSVMISGLCTVYSSTCW